MNQTLIQFYYLGPIISSSPDDFLTSTENHADEQRLRLTSFLRIQPADLTQELVTRYIEVTPEKDHQAITPAHDRIKSRIIEPLKIAKKSYCFEEYVTSIALSGIVGETMAHVLRQLHDTQIDGTSLDSKPEKVISDKEFDRLGQEKRIQILSKLKYISSEQETMLNILKNTRVPYMHWWSLGKTTDDIKIDARNAVINATKLFSSVFNIKLASASSISIDARVESFLQKVGESIGPFYNSKY